MFCLILFLICLFVSIGFGVLAGWSDICGMVIPNLYSAVIGVAFIVAFAGLFLAGKGDVFSSALSHLLAAILVFCVTLVMFSFGVMGAADSKLGTVFGLWVGLQGLVPFLVFMSFVGGALALVALVMGKYKPFKNVSDVSWAGRVQAGESKVPYGVAIVIGAFFAFYEIGYFSPSLLVQFLGA